MKLVSSLAVAASLLFGASAATAAPKPAAAPAAPAQRQLKLSNEARKPLNDLRTAVVGNKDAEYPQLLAAAEAVAKSPDEKYFVAKMRLQHVAAGKDYAAQAAAIEAVIATGVAEPTELAQLNESLGIVYSNAGNFAGAERVYTPILAQNPNDVTAIVNLARAKLELKQDPAAMELLQRAITINKTAGKPVDEAWYRMVLQIAHNQKNRPLALQMARDVLTQYPSEVNLRNALIVYHDGAALDKEADLDLMRLMRASRLMPGSGDYLELAQTLSDAGLPGEAKAVLDEGTRLGVVRGGGSAAAMQTQLARLISEDRSSLPGVEAKARASATGVLAMRTAGAYYGYADYAKAIELYQLALSKGGVDANLVNTRLGMTLALAGRKAEATTAFKAVTGPRADLAALWVAWINQPAGAAAPAAAG
jgi:tetratricopeptide (TPR) repeat protein